MKVTHYRDISVFRFEGAAVCVPTIPGLHSDNGALGSITTVCTTPAERDPNESGPRKYPDLIGTYLRRKYT